MTHADPRSFSGLDSEHVYAGRLARAFVGLIAVTTSLIVLGALVRAHGAGLACPDWPLCFGDLVPRFDLKIGFEWSHRALAGAISIGFVSLSALALRREYTRRYSQRWIALAAALLGIQILLGALTVWKLLAYWTVTSHLLTGNAFNASLILVWRRLHDASRPGSVRAPIGLGLLALVSATGLLLVVQMALGGLVSSTYAGLACDEWPRCAAGEWFPGWQGAQGIHLLHRLGAYALIALLGGAAAAGRNVPQLRAPLALAAALGLLQAGVGIANVLLRIPVEITGLHSLLAACLVMTLAFSLYEAWASPRRASGAAAL